MSPYKPMKPCGYPGCRNLTDGRRYCIEHKKQQQGYGANHRKLRLLYLSEHPICENCQKTYANELHHVDGNNKNLDEDNLEALCKSCHSKRTVEEGSWG